MKKRNFLSILLALCTVIVFAQSNNDQQQLDTAVEELYRAMVDKDGKTLENLTAKDLTYGHSSGKIEDKPQYLDAVLNGSFEFSSIVPEGQNIHISGKTAIVRHIFVAEGTDDGEPTDVRIGVLLIYQKQGGKWKLLARQAYKL
ncbi:nuclear transport factor 2 family protein [Pricia sp.]|uniref:nuclear transport factor 2 family protein n=1 Tax=Pricia sp. TaxID=2268138 RepID=UPI00359407D8